MRTVVNTEEEQEIDVTQGVIEIWTLTSLFTPIRPPDLKNGAPARLSFERRRPFVILYKRLGTDSMVMI